MNIKFNSHHELLQYATHPSEDMLHFNCYFPYGMVLLGGLHGGGGLSLSIACIRLSSRCLFCSRSFRAWWEKRNGPFVSKQISKIFDYLNYIYNEWFYSPASFHTSLRPFCLFPLWCIAPPLLCFLRLYAPSWLFHGEHFFSFRTFMIFNKKKTQ